MTESFQDKYSLSPDNNFEENKERVAKFLKDPEFVELVNQVTIFDNSSDGQRLYSKAHMDMVNKFHLEAEAENEVLQSEDRRKLLFDVISEHTNNFTEAGNCRIEGEEAYLRVDDWLVDISHWNMSLEEITTFAEAEIAGALWLGARRHYKSYQLDLTINGQGLITETYFIDIQFRPSPKNVTSAQVV